MPQQMHAASRKLVMTFHASSGDDGGPIHFCISTTRGLNKRVWVVLRPMDGNAITDYNFRNLARYFLLLNHWAPEDVAWFRYHPPEGLLGAELEAMNLVWSHTRYVYKSARSRRASKNEVTWLKVMGCLPVDADSIDINDGPHTGKPGIISQR